MSLVACRWIANGRMRDPEFFAGSYTLENRRIAPHRLLNDDLHCICQSSVLGSEAAACREHVHG